VELRDVIRAARRRWWLIAAVTAVALAGAACVNTLSERRYATDVTFFVTTPSQASVDSYQGGLFSQQRVKSYVSLITGDRLAYMISAQPGVTLSANQIQHRISARALPDTVLLRATVTDTDRARSKQLATALARDFVLLVQQVETPAGASTPAIQVQIVSGPTLNPAPVSPRPTRNLALAGLLGLLLGLAGAVLRDLLDTTVKTAELLTEVTGAPTLAVVPFDQGARTSPLIADGSRAALDGSRSRSLAARAEALRHLRTNLQFVSVDSPPRVIVITSPEPAEGKSTTSVNLAVAFAEAGARVLLIEADLRHPRVSTYLGLEGAVGLSNVLANQVRLADVVQRWGPHELWVLSSGFVPANPSELLGSQHMVDLLDEVRQRFDMVIVDTPPVLPVTDAAVVAAAADGVVLVARAGHTHRARIAAAVAALERVDSRLLGCVLNMHTVKLDAGYHGYYQAYGVRPEPQPTTSAAIPAHSLPADDAVEPDRPGTGEVPTPPRVRAPR
jgi:capsular exopolysaccharide synthesis family protein